MTTARIVQVVRNVNGQAMTHSDVFIEADGRTFYSRHWYVVDDTPHGRAAELQAFEDRRRRFP